MSTRKNDTIPRAQPPSRSATPARTRPIREAAAAAMMTSTRMSDSPSLATMPDRYAPTAKIAIWPNCSSPAYPKLMTRPVEISPNTAMSRTWRVQEKLSAVHGSVTAISATRIGHVTPHWPWRILTNVSRSSPAAARMLFGARPGEGSDIAGGQLRLDQAAGPDAEGQKQQHEGGDVLVIAADIASGERADNPGQESADEAAQLTAESAERQGDEAAERQGVAERVEGVGDRRGQQSDDSGQRAWPRRTSRGTSAAPGSRAAQRPPGLPR